MPKFQHAKSSKNELISSIRSFLLKLTVSNFPSDHTLASILSRVSEWG